MLTEEGRYWIILIVFIFGIFAFGYFIGWTRDKLTNKMLDKLFSQWLTIGKLEDHARLLIRRLDAKDKDIADLKDKLEVYLPEEDKS